LAKVLKTAALVIGGAALAAFIWAARDDQFEDLDTPPTRALFEDLPAVGDATRGSKGDATPRIGASESANERGSA
jgi:cbb3-type cytochrome oxidase maturation protein